ncbi:MAG TPA: 2,3-bisphosphoglycerate-independent phosphoglycerate mutase [Armatimonadota bacterium]
METKAKGLLLIGDGLGDRRCPELDDQTPLEAAVKPNMDRLAAQGEVGLMDPISPGVRAGSDTAHLSMLGFDPYKCYTGRGPFEAMGIGLDVKQGDVAFRCNFGTVSDDFTITDRRAGRITEGTHELALAIDGMEIEGVKVLFKESVAHRAGMVLRGEGLGDKVSEIDPHTEGLKLMTATGADPASEKTARVLNLFAQESYQRLKDHPVNVARREKGLPPANIILPRGAGFAPHLGSFEAKHHMKGACIVEVGLVKGIGRYLGMTVIDVPGATGGLDTDTHAIGRAVVEAFKDHDWVLCNVKGPDIAGHDGNPKGKVEIIEKIDTMVGYLIEHLPAETTIAITGDHSTPCSVGDHTGEPVPILFWGPAVRGDNVQTFGERTAYQGAICRIPGTAIVPTFTSYMGCGEKFGA